MCAPAPAVQLSEHLGEVSDHLIGHFVDQARRSGASWTEIGQSMGVTKQAAQKRFTPKESGWDELLEGAFFAHPYSRFTERAKHVMDAANEEAREHLHHYVGTEHLALALLHIPEAYAAKTIEALGVSLDQAREALVARMLPATVDQPSAGRVPFTAWAKKALALAVREALNLQHNYIGTEHLLLGLLDEENGLGGKALRELGITRERAAGWLLPELERLFTATEKRRQKRQQQKRRQRSSALANNRSANDPFS
jgi:Clp amino terminal domain, pathogenicity island component